MRVPTLRGPYRVGPWPGLSPSGAVVLLACAVLLASIDLSGIRLLLLVPLAIATRVVDAPGSASGVCGAYLLPRALLSFAEPGVPLPPLLIIPSMAFDLALWLRAADIPRRPQKWRRRRTVDRTPRPLRGAIAGAVFGLTLSVVDGSSVLESATMIGVSALVGSFSARGTAL